MRGLVQRFPNYFPHEASLNYGVLLRGKVPLSRLWPLWVCLPMGLLQAVLRSLMVLAGVQAGRAKPSVLGGVNP
ncbi:MAG: hypothetical protein ACKOF9_05415 [Burkholderiales bacterium]